MPKTKREKMKTKKTISKQSRKVLERACEIEAREVGYRVPIIKHMMKQMTPEDWRTYGELLASGNYEGMAAVMLKYKPKA